MTADQARRCLPASIRRARFATKLSPTGFRSSRAGIMIVHTQNCRMRFAPTTPMPTDLTAWGGSRLVSWLVDVSAHGCSASGGMHRWKRSCKRGEILVAVCPPKRQQTEQTHSLSQKMLHRHQQLLESHTRRRNWRQMPTATTIKPTSLFRTSKLYESKFYCNCSCRRIR